MRRVAVALQRLAAEPEPLLRWDLMESGAGILPHGGALESGAFLDGVQYTMQAAAAAGLTVVRAFGHGHDLEAHLILQPASGASAQEMRRKASDPGNAAVLDTQTRKAVPVLGVSCRPTSE